MHDRDFERLYQLEENYWWFPAMREITDTIVAPELSKPNLRILDVGCGTGFNLSHYAAAPGRDVYGFDYYGGALTHVLKRGHKKIAQGSITEIPFASETFDIVFCLDVASQTPYDTHDLSFAELHRVVKPGGYVFIRTPAFMWLWSSHDEELQVRHRYTRDDMARRVKQAGLEVVWTSYANGFLFPVVLVRRFMKRLGIGGGTDVKPLPRGLQWLDGIFYRVLASEAKWFKSGRRLPFGLSLICYARRPK